MGVAVVGRMGRGSVAEREPGDAFNRTCVVGVVFKVARRYCSVWLAGVLSARVFQHCSRSLLGRRHALCLGHEALERRGCPDLAECFIFVCLIPNEERAHLLVSLRETNLRFPFGRVRQPEPPYARRRHPACRPLPRPAFPLFWRRCPLPSQRSDRLAVQRPAWVAAASLPRLADGRRGSNLL